MPGAPVSPRCAVALHGACPCRLVSDAATAAHLRHRCRRRFSSAAAQQPPTTRSAAHCPTSRSQDNVKASIDALTAKLWTINGVKNVSLAEVGYASAGIDEGWEGCGEGVNGTQHDAQGNPVANSKFPDIPGLVKYGHDAGLKMGWYQNGCACGERHALMQNYEGDVRLLHDYGFDGVKLDGCGGAPAGLEPWVPVWLHAE
jgi:hypothetical protein